jgi:hypothetical protein
MADSSFWRNLGEKHRELQAIHGALRADWDYIVGRGGPGEWRLRGASGSAKAQFEILAKRGASALPGIGSSDWLIAWLDALKRMSLNFKSEPGGSEVNADGSELVHLTGHIARLFEASADYCSALEGKALEAEFREQEQDVSRKNDADAPGKSTTGGSPSEQDEPLEAGFRKQQDASRANEAKTSDILSFQKSGRSGPQDAAAPAQELTVSAADTAQDRARMVYDFLLQCNRESAVGFKVIKKHIWQAAGHAHARQFQYWQERSDKATAEDDRNFRRILCMPPAEFIALVQKKGSRPSGS